jgi:hypothetical protein
MASLTIDSALRVATAVALLFCNVSSTYFSSGRYIATFTSKIGRGSFLRPIHSCDFPVALFLRKDFSKKSRYRRGEIPKKFGLAKNPQARKNAAGNDFPRQFIRDAGPGFFEAVFLQFRCQVIVSHVRPLQFGFDVSGGESRSRLTDEGLSPFASIVFFPQECCGGLSEPGGSPCCAELTDYTPGP